MDHVMGYVDVAFSIILFITLMYLSIRGKSLGKVVKLLEDSQSVVASAEPLLDATPVGPAVHVIDEVLKAAHAGASAAQQLFHNDPAIDRKAVATTYVHDVLAELHIELTDRVKRIVDQTIESAVLFLPKKEWLGEAPPFTKLDPAAPAPEGPTAPAPETPNTGIK